jgi:D-3-phosphoglycerate dehydrogenase / 2-oxoglutarate reductase
MAYILANDGIDAAGKAVLEKAGHVVHTDRVPQTELADFLNERQVSVLLVRSATKVTSAELDVPSLKVVGRAGVGMDNIDLNHAAANGVAVVNTPAASSRSVAELVLAHALGLMRFLPQSNRQMPLSGRNEFAKLKKLFGEGRELEGRTMGIVGLGRIGRATAQLALGLGMKVVATDTACSPCVISWHVEGFGQVSVSIMPIPLSGLLAQSDIISLHVPGAKHGPLIGADEFALMKKGSIIINASRGGVINEEALLAALDSGHLAGAGLDVFANEPTPDSRLLAHPHISVTPHIGAATEEAQERIGIELAEKVIEALKAI